MDLEKITGQLARQPKVAEEISDYLRRIIEHRAFNSRNPAVHKNLLRCFAILEVCSERLLSGVIQRVAERAIREPWESRHWPQHRALVAIYSTMITLEPNQDPSLKVLVVAKEADIDTSVLGYQLTDLAEHPLISEQATAQILISGTSTWFLKICLEDMWRAEAAATLYEQMPIPLSSFRGLLVSWMHERRISALHAPYLLNQVSLEPVNASELYDVYSKTLSLLDRCLDPTPLF